MIYVNDFIKIAIKEAIDEYNNSNVYQLEFTNMEKSNEFGANWHPGAMMHKNASIELVEFIEENILGGR